MCKRFLAQLRQVTEVICRHKILTLEKVNTYGLLYTWQGSDTSLKPMLLMGHQGGFHLTQPTSLINIVSPSLDVVPVDPLTVNQWKQPPFSGYYDGELYVNAFSFNWY